jgi:uncharacterized protein involved in exopolysaccharide biosynthesis
MTRPPFTPELLARVFRNIRLILAVLVIPPAVAVILPRALQMAPKPVYQADAKLTIQPPQGAQGAAPAKIDMPSEINILKSGAVAQGVLSKLTIPAVFPDIASTDASAQEKAIAAFGDRLGVQPVGPSNALDISFDGANPEVAVKVLEALIADFEALHAAPAGADPSETATAETGPIEQQISQKQKELQDLASQRTSGRNADDPASPANQRASLTQQRTQTAADLQDAGGKRDALQKKIDTLKRIRANTPKLKTVDDDAEPVTPAPSPTLTRLMALRRQELELLQKYPPTAPEVQKVHAQISVTEKVAEMEMAEAQAQNSKSHTVPNPKIAALDLQIGSAETDLTAIADQIDNDRKKIAALDDQIGKLQDTEQQDRDLQRRIDDATADLQTLRVKLDMAKASSAKSRAMAARISVTEPPHLVSQPNAPELMLSELALPDRGFLLRVGLSIGAALALLAILASISRRSILTVEGAEHILDMPVVAALPKLRGMRRVGKSKRSNGDFREDPPLSR